MSASTLYDRVVLDVTLPRASRGNSHPAGLRRPWNAREVIVGDREAAEIDRRTASMPEAEAMEMVRRLHAAVAEAARS